MLDVVGVSREVESVPRDSVYASRNSAKDQPRDALSVSFGHGAAKHAAATLCHGMRLDDVNLGGRLAFSRLSRLGTKVDVGTPTTLRASIRAEVRGEAMRVAGGEQRQTEGKEQRSCAPTLQS